MLVELGPPPVVPTSSDIRMTPLLSPPHITTLHIHSFHFINIYVYITYIAEPEAEEFSVEEANEREQGAGGGAGAADGAQAELNRFSQARFLYAGPTALDGSNVYYVIVNR